MELEQTHIIESTPIGYIVTSADIIHSSGFSLLQTVVASTTTTTTTTTTATTATPHTPMNSVPLTMPPELKDPH